MSSLSYTRSSSIPTASSGTKAATISTSGASWMSLPPPPAAPRLAPPSGRRTRFGTSLHACKGACGMDGCESKLAAADFTQSDDVVKEALADRAPTALGKPSGDESFPTPSQGSPSRGSEMVRPQSFPTLGNWNREDARTGATTTPGPYGGVLRAGCAPPEGPSHMSVSTSVEPPAGTLRSHLRADVKAATREPGSLHGSCRRGLLTEVKFANSE